VSSAAVGQANGYVLTGTPSSTMPTVAKLLLYVDAQTFETRRVLLIDGRQDHNRFDFTNIQRNVPVKAGQFVIYPPAGTTVFNMAGTPTNMPVSCP
jgi:outer membrane lipoprotein-sorting protein